MLNVLQPGAFRPRLPFHMVWLATNVCNARCLHCSSNSTVRAPDELTTTEVISLMDQLAVAGVIDVAVSGGEPLLRPDLFVILDHIRSRGLTVGVGSNGGCLTERQATLLARSGVNRFQVSLDGLAEEHDTLRRWPGLFQRALRSIELASNAGLRVHVCCTITRLNFEHLDAFTEFVSRKQVSRINFSRYVPTGRGTDVLDLTKQEWHTVIERCVLLRERFRGKLEIVSHLAQQILVDPDVQDMPGFIGCQAGIGQGCITANGDVLPCVLLPIPIGNVRLQTFPEIWLHSQLIREFQARAGLKGQCSHCSQVQRCGGCRAVAYAKTGDYLAADPRCWLTNDTHHEVN